MSGPLARTVLMRGPLFGVLKGVAHAAGRAATARQPAARQTRRVFREIARCDVRHRFVEATDAAEGRRCSVVPKCDSRRGRRSPQPMSMSLFRKRTRFTRERSRSVPDEFTAASANGSRWAGTFRATTTSRPSGCEAASRARWMPHCSSATRWCCLRCRFLLRRSARALSTIDGRRTAAAAADAPADSVVQSDRTSGNFAAVRNTADGLPCGLQLVGKTARHRRAAAAALSCETHVTPTCTFDLPRAGKQRQQQAHDADDQAAEERGPESGDVETEVEQSGDPAREPQHQRVDDENEETE